MSNKCYLRQFRTAVSETREQWVGSGVTKQKKEFTVYFFAERGEDGKIVLCPLSAEWLPLESEKKTIGEEKFEIYHPEPLIFHNRVAPALERLETTLDRGDRLRAAEKFESAEQEYQNARAMAPDNIRAAFGLGLAGLGRGDIEAAESVFQDILLLEEAFTPRYKHLFNEFGIALRRNGMAKNALQFYTKALALGEIDDHLLFNIARVLYELRQFKRSWEALERALSINPAFVEAKKMMAAVEKQMLAASA